MLSATYNVCSHEKKCKWFDSVGSVNDGLT